MFLKEGNKHKVLPDLEVCQVLPQGTYTYRYDPYNGINEFREMKFNSDQIIDIPTSSYMETLNEFKSFAQEETRLKYEKHGFLYKKSLMLHGPAGTGKTVLVQRVTNEFTKDGAIVVFNPRPDSINFMFDALKNQPEATLIIVLEEVDKLVSSNEVGLLTILDGQEQRPNTIFLMTTNHLERIPKRFLRPSRVSNIVYVGFPEEDARKAFLVSKGVEDELSGTIAAMTEGFTIDELKEVVVGHVILGNSLDLMLKRVREYKGDLYSGEDKTALVPSGYKLYSAD